MVENEKEASFRFIQKYIFDKNFFYIKFNNVLL